LAFGVGFFFVVAAAEVPLRALAEPEETLRARVNDVREEHHLRLLEPSDALAEVARAHAEDMAKNGYLDHVNPDGLNPLERVQAAGVDGFRLLAENIGATNVAGDRIAEVVSSWMNSPLHRENLLNPAFNQCGAGFARGRNGELIAVQLYATFPRN
jgi:uncharacterized protein YkwD